MTYDRRKEDISRILIAAAGNGKVITHTELGTALGGPARGPWKAVLDEISREEAGAGRPDITYMVVKVSTGYPGQIEFEHADPPTAKQKELSDRIQAEVFKYYGA
jgi:hypothetical protein